MASTELEKRPSQAVDPYQEPSVEWGWHGTFPRGTQVAGWISVIACLTMPTTPDVNHTGTVWSVGTGIVLAIGLLVHARRHRRGAA